MKSKVRRVHFVGSGRADASRKQGAGALAVAGCDRPRGAPAAVLVPLRYGDERP
jgi:hypothetical protein